MCEVKHGAQRCGLASFRAASPPGEELCGETRGGGVRAVSSNDVWGASAPRERPGLRQAVQQDG